jgi:hypothetical protein
VLPQFASYARDRTSEFLLDLDNWLTPYSSSEDTDPSPRIATGVNVFLYVDPSSDDKPLASLVQHVDEPKPSKLRTAKNDKGIQ